MVNVTLMMAASVIPASRRKQKAAMPLPALLPVFAQSAGLTAPPQPYVSSANAEKLLGVGQVDLISRTSLMWL